MVWVGDDGGGLVKSDKILYNTESMKFLRRQVGMGDCRTGGIGHQLSSSRSGGGGCRSKSICRFANRK